MKRWTYILIAVVFVLIGGIVACSKGNDNARDPEILVLSSIGDASNLIPMLASDSASHEVAGFIYNGLVKYDKDYNIVPDVASSWDIADGGRTIRFHLRKDVRWHDGKPLTAKDVLFTYKFMVDPKTPTPYSGDYKLVKDARLIDDYTVEFSYDKPFAPALISWSVSIMPAHLLEGKDVTKSELARKPVGTGPFRFKSWEPGNRVVLEANQDYFDGKPGLKGIIYRIIPDQNTEFMELKAGNIDLMGLTPLQYLRQTDAKEFNERYTKYRYLANGYDFLGFNLTRKPFDDQRVRQAIAYAIDKGELIKGVYLGIAEEATGPYKPGTRWYDPKVRRYPHDSAKAMELLKEAGFADANKDGILEKDGKPFTFTIITNQGNSLREKTAQIVQQRLKAVGIEVKIRIIEWTSFKKNYVDDGNFDAVVLGWSITQDPDSWDVWFSGNAGKPHTLNFTGYKNPEVDKLLVAGRETFDVAERQKNYFRIQEILAEEQPYVFLCVPYSLLAVSSRIKGIVPATAGVTYNIEKWYVDKDNGKGK